MTTLRERTQEINAEYWSARDKQTERVAVAQLCLAASPSPGREVAWLIERGYPERPGPTVWWAGGGAPERAWHWTEDAYSARRFPTREAAQHEIDFQAGPHAGALPWGHATEHVFIAAASAELADER